MSEPKPVLIRLMRILVLAVLVFLGASFGFRWMFAVPETTDRVNSLSRPATVQTWLGAVLLPMVAQNPELSAVVPLREGHVAFAARMLLAEAAQDSLDVRYYIWEKDTTGLMLLGAMRRAAERGVRIRMLLDDNGIPDLDPELAELNAHPNVEIRLFNPFVLRRPRMLSYVLDFSRINRRMHNKSFSVDGIATVIGGRNVGDNYFAHSEGVNYFDLDVVALGDAAADVAEDFDLYWASPSAVPAELILSAPGSGGELATSLAAVQDTSSGRRFAASVRDSNLMDTFRNGAQAFTWADVQIVSDDPSKGQGAVSGDALMINLLGQILGKPTQSVDLVSAYFVPGARLTQMLSDWVADDIQVKVLTNAQEATDVLPVHAGYLKYRTELLKAGVQLFELKSDRVEPERGDFLDQFGLVGSSKISLHAKAFVVDESEVFIGSFNFDPRSANLNTEMGFLIKSPVIAAQLYAGFSQSLAFQAYQVRRVAEGQTQWRESMPDGSEIVHDTEPGTTRLSRAVVWIMGRLPIIWLL